MADYNKVILVGRLTRDPELKNLPSGMTVTTMGIAVNNSYTNKDGNKIDDTLFVDVTVFGKQAENVHQYLKKGSNVLIDGRLRYRTWDASDGSKRSKHEIMAQRVVFMGSKSTGNGTSANDNKPVDQNTEPPVEDDDIPF